MCTQPAVTCKRTWGSSGGNRWDFMLGCPLTAAAANSSMVEQGRWSQPHLAVRSYCDCYRWTCRDTQPKVWEVCDDRIMAVPDALRLGDAMRREDASDALMVWSSWMAWSGAAEAALADAFCFAGGLDPNRGFALKRGVARSMVVRLAGPKERKVRNNVAHVS